MDTELWKFFLTQGPFALLFVWLLIFVLRANKERELQIMNDSKERENQIMRDSKEREMQLMETLDSFI